MTLLRLVGLPAVLALAACSPTADTAVSDSDHCTAVQEIPYDGIDQDCDGLDVVDVDEDSFVAVQAGGSDCDDDDEKVNPGAAEIPYDGVDNDCSGADLRDVDGDGHDSHVVGGDDCNDNDATIYPGAPEVPYDDVDQDCFDGDVRDQDADGFDADVVGGKDCDDLNPEVHPEAEERCNRLDDNCDGHVDDRIVGARFATIQETVLYACTGKSVLIPPGTYFETVDISKRDVSLVGLGARPEDTTIDGSRCTADPCTGLVIHDSGSKHAPVRVENLTLQGSSLGSEIIDSFVGFRQVHVSGNAPLGGVYAYNTDDDTEKGHVTIEACEFDGNEATGTGASARGGALRWGPGVGAIDSSIFRDNRAALTGGAVDAYPGVPIRNSSFVRNRVDIDGRTGGGVALHGVYDLQELTGNTFDGNNAPSCPSLAYSWAAEGTVPTSNTFVDSRPSEYGDCF